MFWIEQNRWLSIEENFIHLIINEYLEEYCMQTGHKKTAACLKGKATAEEARELLLSYCYLVIYTTIMLHELGSLKQSIPYIFSEQ